MDSLSGSGDKGGFEVDEASALARSQLAECDTKLARHRAALEAGADPTIVTGWIAEVEAERRRILSALRQQDPGDRRLSREEVTAMVQQLGDIIDVLLGPVRAVIGAASQLRDARVIG